MRKWILCLAVLACMVGSCVGCGAETEEIEMSTITLFAAKSLDGVVDELITQYEEENPGIRIITNYDGSGTLMEQIKEGASCDVFFSADRLQMDELEELGRVQTDTRCDVIGNQVCLVTYKDSNTKVTSLSNIENAESIALADASVPVGKYTRQAMSKLGMIADEDDLANLEIEINTCKNVGEVVMQVENASNEVGTVYLSDLYGREDQFEVLEKIDTALTGEVVYPIAQIVNEDKDRASDQEIQDFLQFLVSQEAKNQYERYGFIPQ